MVVVAGDTRPGEGCEMAPGVCTFDSGLVAPSHSSAIEPFLALAPMRWFFCLNISSQRELFTWG